MRRRRATRDEVNHDILDDAEQDHVSILRHLMPERYEAVRLAYPTIKDQLHPEAWAHFAFGCKESDEHPKRRSRRERDELDRELRQ